MAKEKYGFVYIWRDKKHNRYYIGCHWGSTDDGYICSSRWMKQAYYARPEDFHRRILVNNIGSKEEMFDTEMHFFRMIKQHEVKTRYYNINITSNKMWYTDKEQIKKISEKRKGKAIYKDLNGNIVGLLPTDHPKVLQGEYVGTLTGHTMSEESKEKMRIAKDSYRKITLHFMTYERTLYLNDPEFAILIDYGWTPYTQQERHEESKLTRLTAQRKATQGKFQFSLPDGTFYGFLDIDDPKINELSLIKPIRSEKQIAQAQAQARANASNKEMQLRKGKTMSTRKWFHDPVNGVNRRLLECPIGWKDGRAESSESNKGKETWNDGIRNYMIRDRSEVQSNWTRGMAPRNSQN